MTPLVLIGYGDIARRLAERCPTVDVTACARHAAPRPTEHAGAWQAVSLDLDQPLPSVSLPAGAVWVYLAPPPSSSLSDSRVANLIRWATDRIDDFPAQRPRQVIYASTTAIYGDQGGAWVDEQTPPAPGHDRGRRRMDAERRWQHWCKKHAIPLTILRLPGIYACDRLPLARIRAGTSVVCPDQAPWSNRIHADDLADVLALLCQRADTGNPLAGVFNVADGNPMPMTELYRATAEHFNLPLPDCRPLDEVIRESGPMAREFLSESKRVDASAIRKALNWQPRYPDLRSTLEACDSVELD